MGFVSKHVKGNKIDKIYYNTPLIEILTKIFGTNKVQQKKIRDISQAKDGQAMQMEVIEFKTTNRKEQNNV